MRRLTGIPAALWLPRVRRLLCLLMSGHVGADESNKSSGKTMTDRSEEKGNMIVEGRLEGFI